MNVCFSLVICRCLTVQTHAELMASISHLTSCCWFPPLPPKWSEQCNTMSKGFTAIPPVRNLQNISNNWRLLGWKSVGLHLMNSPWKETLPPAWAQVGRLVSCIGEKIIIQGIEFDTWKPRLPIWTQRSLRSSEGNLVCLPSLGRSMPSNNTWWSFYIVASHMLCFMCVKYLFCCKAPSKSMVF